ncbi:hypothetical protein E2C01_004206 [Portunus trituberculatus]|uniref:Uncharacterized protein n=1 Tax=Portunus trituberculatus TaxID=210409 RepID=A0A5B7CPZ7_PORTR|nr:hypothetical protein [Portunus trituberculatus]
MGMGGRKVRLLGDTKATPPIPATRLPFSTHRRKPDQLGLAPPGHGVMVELVRLRLRRSRRCSASRVEVVPAGSVTRARTRPLARFCGRIPKTRVWRTTFSEVNIEYKKGKNVRGRRRQADRPGPHSGSRENAAASSSRSQAARDRAERLKRIKALYELYKIRNRQNMLSQRHRSQEPQSDSSRYYQRSRAYESSGSRRFYRHLNDMDMDEDNSTRIDNDDLLLDGDRFIYDLDSNTYGATTVRRHSIDVRLLGLGEPAWFNSDFVIHSEGNETDPQLEHYLEDNELERELSLQSRRNASEEASSQDLTNLISESGDEPLERHRRSPRRHHDTDASQTSRRQQYRVSLKNHLRHSSNSRGRNEIIPNKPTKPTHGGFNDYKKIGYGNSKVSLETHSRRGHRNRLEGGRRRKKDEYFVIKTPMRSHWKLVCKDFVIRKSRDCRRDHLAIRINEAHWSRYCGREGPSLALTSSHHASVDVVLNTFRNRSARVMCTWETTLIAATSSISPCTPSGPLLQPVRKARVRQSSTRAFATRTEPVPSFSTAPRREHVLKTASDDTRLHC